MYVYYVCIINVLVSSEVAQLAIRLTTKTESASLCKKS